MRLRSQGKPNRYCLWRMPVTRRPLSLCLAGAAIAFASLGIGAQTPPPAAVTTYLDQLGIKYPTVR